jgi:hypothetical protein
VRVLEQHIKGWKFAWYKFTSMDARSGNVVDMSHTTHGYYDTRMWGFASTQLGDTFSV